MAAEAEMDANRWHALHWMFVILIAFIVLFVLGYIIILGNRRQEKQYKFQRKNKIRQKLGQSPRTLPVF